MALGRGFDLGEKYRERARLMRDMATRADHASDVERLLKLADDWMKLAEAVERSSSGNAPENE